MDSNPRRRSVIAITLTNVRAEVYSSLPSCNPPDPRLPEMVASRTFSRNVVSASSDWSVPLGMPPPKRSSSLAHTGQMYDQIHQYKGTSLDHAIKSSTYAWLHRANALSIHLSIDWHSREAAAAAIE